MSKTTKKENLVETVPAAQESVARKSSLKSDLRNSGYEEGRDKLSPEKSGAEIYQKALGDLLGGELYKLVQQHLSMEKVQNYSTSALESVMSSISNMAQGQSPEAHQELVKSVMGEVSAEFLAVADKWLESENGQVFAKKISNYAETHPRTVAVSALLAAAAAIASNMDIPTLKQKFNIGKGLKGSVHADPAGILDLALDSIGASLEYHRDNITLRGSVEHDFDTGTTGEVSGDYNKGGQSYSGLAKVDSSGLLEAQIGAKWVHEAWKSAEESTGGKARVDGSTAQVDAKSGSVTTEAKVSHLRDQGISLNLGQEFVSDGLSDFFKVDDATARYQGDYNFDSQTAGLGAGLSLLKTDELRTDIDAAIRLASGGIVEDGSLTLKRESLVGPKRSYDFGVHVGQDDPSFSVGGSREIGEYSEIGGKLQATFGGDLRHISAYYGYEEDGFQKAFFQYSREAGANRTSSDSLVGSYERVLGSRFAGKVYGESRFNEGHFTNANIGLMAGYRSSIGGEPVTFLGGVERGIDQYGEGDTALKFGVEVRQIPIVITTDPEFKSVQIGISIGFDLF